MDDCSDSGLVDGLLDACIRSFRHINKAKKKKLLAHLAECPRCASLFTSTLMALATAETDGLSHSTKQSREKAYQIALGWEPDAQ